MLQRISLVLLLVAIPMGLWWATPGVPPVAAQSARQPAASPGFDFYHEFFGPTGYSDPQVAENLKQGMMNGLAVTPPVGSGAADAVRPYSANLMLRLPGATQPAGISGDAIEQQRLTLASLAGSSPNTKVLWNILPEWDQSGGSWVQQGRPKYTGLSRPAAHSRFLNFYASTYPGLFQYLTTPPASRQHLLSAVTDHVHNVFDAYEMGVDVQFLERGIDELGDLSTGLAYLRGAANQYRRAWGIDISTWRSSNGKATTYAANGQLRGGWSASYLRRLTYMSFLSGARMIQNEAVTYRHPDGSLNPFGTVTKEFADFALRRHPDLGHPAISTALLVSPDAGFDPKHGLYNQADAVWYQDIAYSGGDTMMNQFFRLGYPNHWLHGLAPGAPFANAAGVPNVSQFQNFLAAGLDPRPYEPVPTTRWGDQFDVITTGVNAEALQRYRTIVMLGDVTLDARLRQALSDWVTAGGILVMNAAQATRDDQTLVGVTLDNAPLRTSMFFRWLPDDPGRTEPLFGYSVVHPDTAQVWAVNEAGDPLVTSHELGAGQVLFTTPIYLEPLARNSMLALGVQLFDWLFQQNAPATISGPPIAYVVNTLPGKTIVALFNSTESDWNGQVFAYLHNAPDRVLEYVSDQQVPFTTAGGVVTIQTRVPAYDLKVIAVEYSNLSPESPKTPAKHAPFSKKR